MVRIDNSASYIRDQGMSVTEPRKIILSVFTSLQAPISAKGLQRRVSLTDRATIYRTLTSFEEKDILRKITIAGRELYELIDEDTSQRFHFYCTTCKTVEAVVSKDLAKSTRKTEKKTGYKIDSSQFVMYGTCNHCQ